MAKPIASQNEYDAFGRLASQGREIERLKRRAVGPWHYVGDPDEPSFENGWSNIGGTLQQLRYRFLLGAGVEIQGSVQGGAQGTVVFTLPTVFASAIADEGELRMSGSDNTGAHIVWRVKPNGQVLIGV